MIDNKNGYSGFDLEEFASSGISGYLSITPSSESPKIQRETLKDFSPFLLLKRTFEGLTREEIEKARDKKIILREELNRKKERGEKQSISSEESYNLLIKEGIFIERGYVMKAYEHPIRGWVFLGLTKGQIWTDNFFERKKESDNPRTNYKSWIDADFSHKLFIYLMIKSQETLNSMVSLGDTEVPHWQKFSFGRIIINKDEIVDYFFEKDEDPELDPETRNSKNKERKRWLKEKIENALYYLNTFQFRIKDKFWAGNPGSFIISLVEREGDPNIILRLNPEFFDGVPLKGRVEKIGKRKVLSNGYRPDYIPLPQLPRGWRGDMEHLYLYFLTLRGKGLRGFGRKKREITVSVKELIFHMGIGERYLDKNYGRIKEKMLDILLEMEKAGAIKMITPRIKYDGKIHFEIEPKLEGKIILSLSLDRSFLWG